MKSFISPLLLSIALSPLVAGARPAATDLKFADVQLVLRDIVSESAEAQDEALVVRNALRGFIAEGGRLGHDYTGWMRLNLGQTETRQKALGELQKVAEGLPSSERAACCRAAIEAMVGELNEPGSQFFEPGKYRQSLEELGYSLGGIGVYLDENPDEGLFKIIQVMEGLPSEKLGILPGDRILAVNGVKMKGVELKQLSGALRGTVGTSVDLEILRSGQLKKFTVQREWLRPNPQGAAAQIAAPGIGWIRLKYLGLRSDADVLKLWKELQAKGAQSLILDMRNCPGELHGVVPLAGLFLPKGSVVYNLEKRQVQDKVVTTVVPSIAGSVVVLINSYSGDAAATLAGSLRDADRAVLIGQATKLSEMKAYRWLADELSDGSTLSLVTQWLRLPRGQDLSHAPLQPDLAAKSSDPSAEVTGAKDDVAFQRAVKFLQNLK